MSQSSERMTLSIRQVIDNMLEGVMITDHQGSILAVNSAFTTTTGYSLDDVIGKNPRFLQSGRHTEAFYKKMWASINRNGYWQGEIWNRKKNGREYIECLTISAIKNTQGVVSHYLGVFSDVTRQKQAEDTIRHMAYFDPLTNLPNRALFRDRLKQALSFANRNQNLLAVLFIDLDRVKVINDTLGHDIGDRLLQGVARRLEGCLREIDTIARLGGDEFMVLLPNIQSTENVVTIAEKLLDSLRPAFHFDGHELYITASIGISVFPNDATDAPSLLKNADTAMYRAKKQGRNLFQVFTKDMGAETIEQLSFENSMRRALEREEFVVHYQPQINIASGHIVGMEALVRWQHPEKGLIFPQQFIHWAEDTGLIVPIGEWVLRKACHQNKVWHQAGYHHLKVAVNLSAVQFKQKNLLDTVSGVLRESGLPPGSLELELTESVVMEHASAVNDSVPHQLKAMGVRLSIDDFGTGYSSLNYLKKLPVNTLKMDQMFVRDLTVDRHDAAIASAIINMGHGLNLTVVAEGVETEHQLQFLKNFQCDGMQGFYYSRPVPADEFELLLKNAPRIHGDTLFDHKDSILN
jgi:diguanylate cyclase (GGDEF)-like protein/PAS domain S-box-containing protein